MKIHAALMIMAVLGIGSAWGQIDAGIPDETDEPNTATGADASDLEQRIEYLEEQVADLQYQLRYISNVGENNPPNAYRLDRTMAYLFEQLRMFVPDGSIEVINDDFDNGLDGWQLHKIITESPGWDEYSDYTLINPSGIIHIRGEGFLTYAGIIKRLNLPDRDDIDLSFDGWATGTAPTHKSIPNLVLIIFVDDGEPQPYRTLDYPLKEPPAHYVLRSDRVVSGWQDISFDLTEYAGQDVSIFIGVSDLWIADWHQAVSIDNVVITAK